MQILAISPSRRSNQVWLKFDDTSFLPLKVDDLVVLKIKKQIELSDEQYQNILQNSAAFLISEYSLRQVAISPKVESILRQKIRIYCQKLLAKYPYSSEILREQSQIIIDRLTQSGLLDQSQYIDYLVRKYPKKSKAELNYKLQTLGIKATLVYSETEEILKIKKLISTKYKNIDLTDYHLKNNLISKLYRKGFALELIKTAIDESLKVR